jgi:hypothetical protein
LKTIFKANAAQKIITSNEFDKKGLPLKGGGAEPNVINLSSYYLLS